MMGFCELDDSSSASVKSGQLLNQLGCDNRGVRKYVVG
jgi:hypothetical protein